MVDSPRLEFVTPEKASQFLDWLVSSRDEYLSVDTETTGLDVWHDRIRMVQFGDRERGWAIPYETSESARELVDYAMKYYANAGIPLSAHRMKFDALFLRNAGHDVSAICQDGKAAAHLKNSTMSGLKEASAAYLGSWTAEGQGDLKAAMKKNRWTWETVPIDAFEYWWYAALDPVLESRLQAHLEPTILQHYHELYEMEIDVSLALQEAEVAGIPVDLDYCQREVESLTRQIDEEGQLWREAEINTRSTKQLAPLFEEAGFVVPRKAPTARMISKGITEGNPSIDDTWLESLPSHPMVDSLRRLRHLYKQRDTYFGPYLELAIDGKIHTFVETLGARTGRMSDRNPNLQNVPKREDGDYIRRAFTATPGCILLLADYAQIEYRIFASAAGEPDMIEAILNGEDLHAVTAQMVYDDPSITKEDPRRDTAKNGNFAEIYMAGLAKFAATAGITLTEAESFKSRYHKKFTRVKPFSKAVMNYARANGLAVDTRFGRTIPVDADKIYAAVNYMIQGSAADVLKRAIQRIAQTEWGQYLRLPIHDELIFEVPVGLADRLERELPELMEDRDTFRVPLEIEISRAYRWGEKIRREAA